MSAPLNPYTPRPTINIARRNEIRKLEAGLQEATDDYGNGLIAKREFIYVRNLIQGRIKTLTDDALTLCYAIYNPTTDLVKIGVSKQLASRLQALRGQTGCDLTVLSTRRGGYTEEKEYHRRLADFRVMGEWFDMKAPPVREAVINFHDTGCYANHLAVGRVCWRGEEFGRRPTTIKETT